MNFAVLLLPEFALQALLRAEPQLAGKPVALAAGDGRKARLFQVSAEATNVEAGLAVTLALARCPRLIIRPRNSAAEAECERLLLAAAFTLSPRVEVTDEGHCTANLQGADFARTEKQMLACVAELAAVGLVVRVGVSATPLLAFYAAQRASSVCVVRNTLDFLRPLPISVASPSAMQVEILNGWGIATLGQLIALPKAEIARRLGTDGVQLWERAAGEATRVLNLIEPSKTFVAEWTYDPPVESMEPLLFRLRRFAECVALELRAAQLVADRLSLALLLEDDTEHRREFRLSEPSVQVDGWLRVLQAHLDTVRTEARVTGVRLAANPARPPEKQDGLFETGLRDPAVFWENLARLSAIVGDDCVGTPVTSDTWRPDEFTMERPAESIPPPELDPVHAPRGLTLRRFRPAWPAKVGLVRDRPTTIEADALRDEVRHVHGPIHLSGDWWQPRQTWRLEIWHVETKLGATYQLAHTLQGWCVEGVYD